MERDLLVKHFEAMGARLKFRRYNRRIAARSRRLQDRILPPFSIDVTRDRRGEYFDLAVSSDAPEFEILQTLPKEKHLLLYTSDRQRFLCGHDERHWFVAAIGGRVSTVLGAKRSLLPPAVWEQVKDAPPGELDKRRNAVFKRQGEWFFVPVKLELDESTIHRNERLQRTAQSKPHLCQEVIRQEGVLVYIISGNEFSKEAFEEKRKGNPHFGGPNPQTMFKDPKVYVRHPDHKTLVLDGWHRVFINAEMVSTGVAFLD